MGKLNKVQLIGNLGDDIKMHFFDGGGCIGRVSLATTEKYKKQDNSVVENTEWHSLVFRNKLAETIDKWTSKGSQLYVEGRLKYRQWEQDGVTKYSTEIHVREFEFLSKSENTTKGGTTETTETPPKQQQSSAQPTPPDDSEDDLPF